MKKTGSAILIVILALVAVFLLIQLVPFGRNHSNPPVVGEPTWNSPQTRLLAQRACFDCHSNETQWPWYSNVAPLSWLVQRDVQEGRDHLNFSEWGQGRQRAEDSGETIREGRMPPAYYILTHPQAKLSVGEKDTLIRGLVASIGAGGGETSGESEGGEGGE